MGHRSRAWGTTWVLASPAAVLVTLVALVVPATATGAARPPDLVCGQTITTSVVLRTDLACAGDGLVVGAGNVTISLAGHTISSTTGSGAGIRLGAPVVGAPPVCPTGVEVRGGTISGFFAGVAGAGCLPSVAGRVTGTTFTGNTWGVHLGQGIRLAVDRSTITGPNGIGGPFAPGAVVGTVDVSRSTIVVTDAAGFSILDAFGPPGTLDRSRLVGGRLYGVVGGGVAITSSRLDDVVVDCSDSEVWIADSQLDGGAVVGGAACGHTLVRNRFVGPGAGVAVRTDGVNFLARIIDNTFTGWTTAVEIGFSRAVITGNTFRGNGTGVACVVTWCNGTVSGNTFRNGSGTALLLPAGTWEVGSNTAVGNGGLGIDAAGPGLVLTDAGGNVAHHNLPPQCIGVVCARHP